MNTASQVDDDPKLLVEYRSYNRRVLARGLMVGNGLSVIGVPGGFILDYFLAPQHFVEFLLVRLGVALVLLGIIGLLHFGRNHCTLTHIKILGVLSALTMNFAFCLMIFQTGGALSPYYAGLNLIITCWSILLPWTVVETATMCIASLGGYAAACLIHPSFWQATAFPLFAFNVSFILITTAVCLSITFFLSRARFQDFRLRHQLDVQNRELQDLDRLKTQFFSNISHELRTPLTLILGPAETLLSRGDALEKRVHEGLLLIHRNTLRLLKLINDLLDLAKLDQGAEILRKKKLMVAAFVKGIVESVRHLGLSKQLRLEVEAGDPAIAITADPARLEKILINLLTNALKYTPAGGTIRVRWGRSEAETWIEVSDTGVGIPPEDLAKIFDRFHQVRSNMRNQIQGVGVGLALAKELAEEHGGALEVQSEVDRGTTFRIRLPDEDASPVREESASPRRSEAEEPFERAFRSADRSWRSMDESASDELPLVGQGEQMLLVADDEKDMRGYVVSLLAEDFRIIQTHGGSQVADLVAKHEPELVLLDWMMPDKDGLTVCRELRADPNLRDLKIVLLTARIDEKSKIDALQAGADDFLTKPFSSVEVKTRVSNLLRAARLQKDLRSRNEELSTTIGKLQTTETMLIQSEKMNAIGSLSAGLLHEINNPLNYTLTAVGFAKSQKDTLSAEMQEVLDDIEEGMERVRDVVTPLKNFAYPEKSGTESIFSLREVFASARKIMAKETDGIEIAAEFAGDPVIRGQKTQIIHLFINLLGNAARALHEQTAPGPKKIWVEGVETDEGLVLKFRDNGPGIPPEIMERIFEPFFTTREVGSGMGMGLSICHTIMENHHGRIQVENHPEGGATFNIHFPTSTPTP